MRDLVIIGGGLSGTLTLLSLADALERGVADVGRPRRVVLLDRNADFGGGVAYGARAHPSHLLNENVATMDVRGFRDWLLRTRDVWTKSVRERGGGTVQSWMRFNAAALSLARDDVAALDATFVPRCVFGDFLRERLHATLDRVERRGLLRVERVAREAIALQRLGAGVFGVELREAAPIRAGTVLLAVGSLPPDPAPHLGGDSGYVHDPYARSFEEVRSALLGALARVPDSPRRARRVLVLGSNAAAMELLAWIANDPALEAPGECVVLSTGTLPDARRSARGDHLEPRRLRSLARAQRPTARGLWEAARRDVACARAAGCTSLDYTEALGAELRVILAAMSLAERHSFVACYGKRVTALHHHTPPEYADAAAGLAGAAKLVCHRVRVDGVDAEPSADGRFVVHARRAGRDEAFRGDAVVNCRGSGALARTEMPLLQNILDPTARVACCNSSGLGIEVSPDLEASPGVFVLGPLLAGHASDDLTLWNLESAPRIDALAARLATTLAKRWSEERSQ